MAPVLMSPGGYPLPTAEEERLAEVLSFDLAERRPEGLDAICSLARELFGVPVALVTLVGRDDCQMIAASGGPAPRPARRNAAFCAWTICADKALVVEDAAADPRFATLAEVAGDAHVRFYAGAPLLLRPGVAIGSLALFAHEPRCLTAVEAERLKMLADMAVAELKTQRELAELARRESLVSSAAHLTKVGSWAFEVATGKLSWSVETCRIVGLPEDAEPRAETMLGCFPEGEARAWGRQTFHDLKTLGVVVDREVEIQGPLQDRPRWVRWMAQAEREDDRVVRVVGSVQDVTDRREAEAHIQRLAYRDTLTGLPNRTLFQQTVQLAVETAARRGGQVGLILLDLDHFKDVNDSLGHEVGDALLCSVADRLSAGYRKTDMVARLGGDEFAVILPKVHGPEDLVRPTEKVLELLRHPLEHDGRTLSITASVGVAVYPDGAEDGAQLLKNADIALFQAKAAGRNRIVAYEPEMRYAVERRIEMLREVRVGLTRGEFMLHYQPVVDVGPGGKILSVAGFEALTRWKHPAQGQITPQVFMAAFEDHELSLQLGEATLEGALRQMRAWMDADIEFGRVAVNVSAAQFRTGRLAEAIGEKLAFWNVPADRLCIEVTENVYMGWGAEVVGEAARALHEMGVQVALDDFGTGYASLTHLKSFPIDRLKIDRSFVQGEEDGAIVRAVATMGARLGMTVIAEGVETAEQLAFLAEAGCGQAQGYHIGRPMPAADVPAYLAGLNPSRVAKPKLRLA